MLNQSEKVIKILGTKYPLIQAPMNWLTNAELVAAVSNSGGLGILGPNAGQREAYSPEVTYQKFREEIQKTKSITDKNFGINVLLPINPFSEALLNAAIDEGVKYFATVGDADSIIFKKIKENNGVIIHRPLNPNSENMREAESLGVDLLVATGYDEGGVIPSQQIGTFSIVPAMVDSVSIPVLAAGGINDKRGVKAAFALGASGVYIGTRFLLTKESPMSNKVKEQILKSKNQDMLLVAKQQRSLNTKIAVMLESKYEDLVTSNENIEIIRENGGIRSGMLEGDLENGIISLNTSIEIIKNIPSVKDLIEELMN
ncbi:NAD(P)H-dependent flavin oxidoreductase [Fusobacterium animalis]|jgi:dioxygenase|uniref:2-nitropropane dioxygenase n=2 Tax=Fusobacterium animalis TaxID=76859 RepID=A0A0M4SBS5_9FUSO|nr:MULTISPECIES: DUF561 domain-containing protein [Fusobacterium]ALF16850.1 2-nitropropane dioxygenase [Fusobacterium animalis]EGN64115.1 enoyl-(acyl-carrier-protein) reductase II [Fusobacterium animalis 11_3_2]